MLKNVLFDLDGTVTDPLDSITGGVVYALEKFGIIETDPEKLRPFVGPPLIDSFQEFYGFTEEQARLATKYHREIFVTTGIFQNRLYEGMDVLLKELKERGVKILLATSKPVEFAEKILELAGVLQYFDFVGGNDLKESRPKKELVIQYVLDNNEGITAENTLMIGDRKFDVNGAHAFGLKCVGVLYGYGDRAELEAHGADYIVEDVAELREFLKKW